MYVFPLHACLVPLKARRGCWVSWNCSYRYLLAAMLLLGTEPGFFARAVYALKHQVISPSPSSNTLTIVFEIFVLCISCVAFVTEHYRALCVNFFRKHIVLGIYVVCIFVLGSKHLELVIGSVPLCRHLVSPLLNGCLDSCLTQLVML